MVGNVEDTASVFAPGPITVHTYTRAIDELMAARQQLRVHQEWKKSGKPEGVRYADHCAICGEASHLAEDCPRNVLVVARRWWELDQVITPERISFTLRCAPWHAEGDKPTADFTPKPLAETPRFQLPIAEAGWQRVEDMPGYWRSPAGDLYVEERTGYEYTPDDICWRGIFENPIPAWSAQTSAVSGENPYMKLDPPTFGQFVFYDDLPAARPWRPWAAICRWFRKWLGPA